MPFRQLAHGSICRASVDESALDVLEAHLAKADPGGLHIGERSFMKTDLMSSRTTEGVHCFDTVTRRNFVHRREDHHLPAAWGVDDGIDEAHSGDSPVQLKSSSVIVRRLGC